MILERILTLPSRGKTGRPRACFVGEAKASVCCFHRPEPYWHTLRWALALQRRWGHGVPCLRAEVLSPSPVSSSPALGRRTLGNVCDPAQRGWVWFEQQPWLAPSPDAAPLPQLPLSGTSSKTQDSKNLGERWTGPCGTPTWLPTSLSGYHCMASVNIENKSQVKPRW